MTPQRHEALLRRVAVSNDWITAEQATRSLAWCEACRAVLRAARALLHRAASVMRRRSRA